MPRRKSYSKGYESNWKKYILWYIIAAVIVYGLIYFLFLNKPAY